MKKVIAIICIVFSVLAVKAQQNKPLTLSYKEAVDIALKNNVTLNQQKNVLFLSQVQKSQSIAAFLPSLGIGGSYEHVDGQQPNPNGGDLQNLSVNNVSAGISAEMMIFNGFNLFNSYSQSVNLFKAQTALVARTEQEVIFNVTTQYLQVLLDQELLRIAEENYATQKVVYDQLKELVNLGARPEAELYTQEAQVRNMELLALRSRVTLDNDKATLAQILQLDPAISFEVRLPEFEESLVEFDSVPMDSLYAIAFMRREDLKQLEYQMLANHNTYKASIAGYLPRISLFARYGSQYTSALSEDPSYGQFNNQFTNVFPRVSYGINIAIPIFDRLQTRTTRVMNRVEYENTKLRLENLQKSIKVDVQRAYYNYRAAVQAYSASQAQYQAGELALRTQQESYTLGASDQVALAQANQTFVTAAASRAQAEISLAFQEILLNYALGTLKSVDIK